MRFSLCVLLSAEAQSPAKIPKIGFLGASPASRPWHELFLREFRKLGYVDGKNATFIYRFADTNYDRLPALADELVRLKVNVIITPGSNDTRAAKNATRTIPIVFLGAGSDPVALGLVESLAWRQPHGGQQYSVCVGWQKVGVAQGNRSQARPGRGALESAECGLCAGMERKPTSGKGTGLQLHSMAVNSADDMEGVFKETASSDVELN